MFTTAGLIRSATSAKLTAPTLSVDADRAIPRDGPGRGALERTGVRVTPPAMMTPTRNATVDESASVTRVNRRISAAGIHYKALEFVFGEGLHAELPRFRQLAAGVFPHDEVGGLAAQRTRHFPAPLLDRSLGFLAGHRRQRAGE